MSSNNDNLETTPIEHSESQEALQTAARQAQVLKSAEEGQSALTLRSRLIAIAMRTAEAAPELTGSALTSHWTVETASAILENASEEVRDSSEVRLRLLRIRSSIVHNREAMKCTFFLNLLADLQELMSSPEETTTTSDYPDQGQSQARGAQMTDHLGL